MRIKKNKYLNESDEMDMTPMIDIVFQLLIFFLLSAKFIALEAQLSSYLPKDKGLSSVPSEVELVQVSFDLIWAGGDDDGRVVCRTMDYRKPGSGAKARVYEFGSLTPDELYRYGPGEGRQVEWTSKEQTSYAIPDYQEMEDYLKYRKDTYEDPKGKGLPVTVNFDGKVPVQAVTVILDICDRLGIQNFTLTAIEQPID